MAQYCESASCNKVPSSSTWVGFIEMQDLLHGFTDPNVIDIKMGTRTFLESEVTNLTARSDLYQKVRLASLHVIAIKSTCTSNCADANKWCNQMTYASKVCANRSDSCVNFAQMVKVDPSAPTKEENELQAVTKLRYMTFREQQSSSCSLGYRIEALKACLSCCNSRLLFVKDS